MPEDYSKLEVTIEDAKALKWVVDNGNHKILGELLDLEAKAVPIDGSPGDPAAQKELVGRILNIRKTYQWAMSMAGKKGGMA